MHSNSTGDLFPPFGLRGEYSDSLFGRRSRPGARLDPHRPPQRGTADIRTFPTCIPQAGYATKRNSSLPSLPSLPSRFQCVPNPPRACIGRCMAKWPARPTRPPPTIRAGRRKTGPRSPSRTARSRRCGTSTSVSTARRMAEPSSDSRNSGPRSCLLTSTLKSLHGICVRIARYKGDRYVSALRGTPSALSCPRLTSPSIPQ
jgi:hypothetical protein